MFLVLFFCSLDIVCVIAKNTPNDIAITIIIAKIDLIKIEMSIAPSKTTFT